MPIRPDFLRRLYPGIHARTTGPFLLVVLIVAAISVFTITRLVAGSIQERFDNQLAESANAASNAIVQIERQQLATLRQMVFTEGVAEAIATQNATDLDTWLRPIVINESVHDVIVFDAQGNAFFRLVQVDTRGSIQYMTEEVPDLSDWESVNHILAGASDTLGDKFVDIYGEPARFYISAPVINEDGVLIGGISIGLRLQDLASVVRDQALSGIVLYLENGTPVAATFSHEHWGETALSPDQNQTLLQEVQRRSPIEEMEIDGRPYQILYAPFQIRSDQIGLMGVALPSNFIVERSSTSRDTLGVLFSLLAGLVVLLGLVTARSITQPVGKLVATTRAIREGDLSQRVNLSTPDELGELAVSFDHMTAQLVQRNQEISGLYHDQILETARRQAVLASISDAVIVLNPAGEVFLHNAAAERLLMLSSAEGFTDEVATLLKDPLALAEPHLVNFSTSYYSVLSKAVHLDSGELIGYVVVFRDITEIMQAEKLKDEIMMQMSHELRTPLTAIQGYVDLVQMLEGSKISDQGHQFIDKAKVGLNTLGRMVNQVIDVSAIISDRLNLERQTFDLMEIISKLLAEWEPRFKERGIAFSYFSSLTSLWMEGDAHYLAQVFDHLLLNAHNYTLPGKWAEMQIKKVSEQVIIAVLDGGVGIDESEQNKVFERMYRGRSADAGPTDARGLGLGLYIAQYIVEKHNGSIHLTSQLDNGTSVIVTLPLVQSHNGAPLDKDGSLETL